MRNVAYALMIVTLCAATALAQEPQLPAKPGAPAAGPPAQSAPVRNTTTADPINIRYQILIRETGGPQPGTKSVTLTMALNEQSSIRAQGVSGTGRSQHPLNVDVHPMGLRDNKVRTRLSVEYTPTMPEGASGPPPFFVRETLNVWLDTGKPMVVSEAADPVSDRRLTVEVTATILR